MCNTILQLKTKSTVWRSVEFILTLEKTKPNISCSNGKWNQKSSQGTGGEVQPLTELLQMAKVNLGPWGGERREGCEGWNPAAVLQ